jgi:hypothetical protein
MKLFYSILQRTLTLVLLGSISAITRAQITFTNLVDNTMIAPGQSTNFTDFVGGCFSSNNFAILGAFSGGEGIYTGSVGGSLNKIVDTSSIVPNRSTNFTGFYAREFLSLSGNNVVFRGAYSGGNGIYSGIVGSEGASRIVDTTVPVPRTAGTFLDFHDLSVSGNNVVFTGTTVSGPPGIYSGSVGTTGASMIVDASTPVPGQPGLFFDSGGGAKLSGNNFVLNGVTGFSGGIYTGSLGTTGLTIIADKNMPIPGGTGNFTSLSSCIPVISGNTVAFWGGNSNLGIYKGVVGATGVTRVADKNTPVPGEAGNFTSIAPYSYTIIGNNVAFSGNYAGGNGTFIESSGGIIPVLKSGDTLFGSTVTNSFPILQNDALNALNSMGIRYNLADGRFGYALVNLPSASIPEPGTIALFLSGSVLFVVKRRRI